MDESAHVLVVDDEPRICDLLRTILVKVGHQVDIAHSGEEALQRLSTGEYDVLLADLVMPGIDGVELIRRAREQYEHLATIMITGYATVETAVKALHEGIDDYITKPFNVEELRDALQRVLAARRTAQAKREIVSGLESSNKQLQLQKNELLSRVETADNDLSVTAAELQERVNELRAVHEIGRVVTSVLDLDRVLDLSLDLINEKLGVSVGSIMLVDAASGDLVVQASRGRRSHEIVGEHQQIGRGIAGWVAANREPVLVVDIDHDKRFKASECASYHTGSCVCAPLLREQSLLGVISATDRVTGAPMNEADLRFLVTVGQPLSIAIENADLYRALEHNCFSTVRALVTSLEAKDRYTSGHSQRVTEYASRLAGHLGLEEEKLDILRHAGMLHDVGKIGITESILNKPSRLTGKEMNTVRSHPSVGERIVEGLEFLRPALPVIRGHHERWDGKGYPDSLRQHQIPLLARIMGIADTFDAMTSKRPYRPPLSHDAAMEEMRTHAGRQFDPELVEVFCESVDGGDE